MPFTISHAAAALPFRRTRLIMSAVVVGCFAPDFEYFNPLGHHSSFGHTLPGVFELDLPLGLVVLWMFHRFAREPLADCLPDGARERLDPHPTSPFESLSRFAITVFSLLVGIATHILWDAFTHSRTWITDNVNLLDKVLLLPLFGPRPLDDILQYFSSAFGLVVILLWYIHWYRNTPPVHSRPDAQTADRIAIAGSFLIAMIVALVRAATFGTPNGIHGLQRFMTDAAITAITVLWIEIVIYGVFRDFSRKSKLA